MQTKLTINGLDLRPYIAEGGITQSETYRQSRSVTTLDGTLYQTEVIKRTLSISLLTMLDKAWMTVTAKLAVRPLEVLYIDDTLGERQALFYVTSMSSGIKQQRSGLTWYTGCSFELEER